MIFNRRLHTVFRAILNQIFFQPSEIILVHKPRKIFQFLNLSPSSKGPGAVVLYLRTALLACSIPHRVVPFNDDFEKSVKLVSEKFGNLERIHLPSCDYNISKIKFLCRKFKEAKILVGPNFDFSLEELELMLKEDSTIQNLRILLPSEAILELFKHKYRTLTNCKKIFVVIPSTVDTCYWKSNKQKRAKILIYHKGKWSMEDKRIVHLLGRRFPNSIQEIEYGSYTRREYRKQLINAKCLVYLADTESQGIALLESWSCDVPTYIRVSKQELKQNSKKHKLYGYTQEHYAPFLSENTGRFFQTFEQLEIEINELDEKSTLLNPRDWVLQNLSSRMLKEIMNGIT